MENQKEERREQEIVYSRSVKAGKRIYYLDVRKARNNDLYLSITESKRRQAEEGEAPSFEKHKVFLYKEDFAHFTEGLQDVIRSRSVRSGILKRKKTHRKMKSLRRKVSSASSNNYSFDYFVGYLSFTLQR